jgi:hypothetical protein
MSISTVYTIVLLHFVFDWLLQPHKIAITKSQDPLNLGRHLVYNIVPYLLACGLIIQPTVTFSFFSKVVFNIISHGVIDWNIYRLHKRFVAWLPEHRRSDGWLFKFIAVDQMLHLAINLWTFS